MSLKQYNWTDGEVITADKLNRGGVTIVEATTETIEGKLHITLDMTLQEIYDAMGKGIVVLIMTQQDQEMNFSYRIVYICFEGNLAKPEQERNGFLYFRSQTSSDTIIFQCATNDSFPQYKQQDDPSSPQN